MTDTEKPREVKRLPGTPVANRCGACQADLSPHSYFTQIVLPVPQGREIGFAPQMVIISPMVCPECGTAQVRQQSVVVPGRGGA